MVFHALIRSLQILRQDRIILLLSLVPLFIGGFLYFLFGKWLYTSLLISGKAWISSAISAGGFGSFLGYLLATLLTVVLFFIINLTFVMIVSLISSPFNDIISGRVETALQGRVPESLAASFGKMMAKLLKTLWNEVKKITFILIVTVVELFMSLVPILAPVSIILATLLLAATFLDYSWCRHSLTFGGCLKDIKSSPIIYSLGGLLFITLLSIPLINLITYPLATIYFTTLFVLKEEH
jgi:CysZ protein